MNDDIREKLSAYLDGALSEMDRKSVEGQLAGSEDMRRELEALRAVSASVKGLPKEKLPAGFMARLEARRARDSKPEREYFMLPPAYRPLAFALSTAVFSLVVWDKTRAPSDIAAPRVGWDSEKVSIKSAADAPPSIDVSGQLSAMGAPGKSSEGESAAKKDAADKIGASSTFGKHISAPGKPLEVQEADGLSAPAEGQDGALTARNEEERSAINERLYKGYEEDKKRMGIAKIIDKDEEERNPPSDGREMMTLQAAPEAARVDRGRSSMAAARGAAKAKGGTPAVKALALRSADALFTAWAAAGLPGEPPAVDFPEEMAVFLAGPQGCGIVGVQHRKKFIVVLYKDTGFDDASARVRATTLSPKPVVVKRASR